MPLIQQKRDLLALPLAPAVLLVGFAWGLLQRPQFPGVQKRGIWVVLAWPVKTLWAGQCWIFEHTPLMCAVEIVATIFLSVWGAIAVLTPTDPATVPPVGKVRYESGTTEVPGAGKVRWQVGDTEAVIRAGEVALICSPDEVLYSKQQAQLVHSKTTVSDNALRLPAETFLAGYYCGALHSTDYRSHGVRMGPVAHASPGQGATTADATATGAVIWSGAPTLTIPTNTCADARGKYLAVDAAGNVVCLPVAGSGTVSR